MIYGCCFSIICLVFITMFSVIYFSKKRINSLENKIYSLLLITNMIGLILDITGFVCFKTLGVGNDISVIVSKIYLIYYFSWTYFIMIYFFVVSFKNKKISDAKKKKYTELFTTIYLLMCVVTILLPFEVKFTSEAAYSYGMAVNVVYFASFICILLMIIFMICNKTNLKNKAYYPFFAFMILGGIALYIQKCYPDVMLLISCQSIVTSLMYFTIENPDIKMLNQVTAAKDAADKANRAKSDFLSSMSHEIRTPLNAIVGFSECIKNADSLEEAKENAADIVTASESLLEIVNGILDISKIESGKLELVQSDYDIYKILDEVVKLIKARLGDKPLNFEVNIAEDIPHVLYGDHFNIKKILINFLTNAVKYTDEGYVKFDVKCVIVNNNVCRLIMSVKDCGRGITKKNIDKLFTKFQRLDEDKNTTIEGTGLGLAITKQLVEMMHGKIVVNSIYGEGSEFTVAIDQRISNHKLETQEDVSDDVIDLSGRKILVVDDNKLNLKVAVKLLQPYKCVVETCESGFGCIDKITSGNKYDIILLDDMMPKMRGSETLTRLKADSKFNIPVVALTANAIQGMREQYMLLGFDDYLAKPIDKKELNRILNKYVLKNALVEGNDKPTKTVEEKPTISESPMEENINFQDYTGKKILIVDDNKLNVKVATKIMNPYHFEIDSAYSGLECLNKVKNTKYDIIFMDYMMPNMDGIETFRQLHEDPSFKTPVISLTADAVVGAKDKFINAGFNGYVSKPIDKKMLDDAINKALKDR